MYGITESLNLAVCSGIVLHEVARQRRNFLNLNNHEFIC
jgi:tRNA G18 (ribose-2'-O)-methylase SpoU